MTRQADVAVVGGGPVALSLALALHHAGVSTLLVRREPAPAAEQTTPRHFALSLSSTRCLEGLGLWRDLAPHAAPIEQIVVSQPGPVGSVHLSRDQAGVAQFGAVIHEVRLLDRLAAAVAETEVPTLRGEPAALALNEAGCRIRINSADQRATELSAELVVAADGGQSPLRTLAGLRMRPTAPAAKALCAEVTTSEAHDGRAFERLTPAGPIALLPVAAAPDRWCLVWVLADGNESAAFETSPDRRLLDELQRRFGWRAGRFEALGPTQRFSVAPGRARRPHAGRLLLIGDAAHRLHPVAGQGLNLGLRDVALLTEMVCHAGADRSRLGAIPAAFVAQRRTDWRLTVGFTSLLSPLFHLGQPARSARGLALGALDLFAPAKRHFARRASGMLRQASNLERGLPPV